MRHLSGYFTCFEDHHYGGCQALPTRQRMQGILTA